MWQAVFAHVQVVPMHVPLFEQVWFVNGLAHKVSSQLVPFQPVPHAQVFGPMQAP